MNYLVGMCATPIQNATESSLQSESLQGEQLQHKNTISEFVHSQLKAIDQCYSNFKAKCKECILSKFNLCSTFKNSFKDCKMCKKCSFTKCKDYLLEKYRTLYRKLSQSEYPIALYVKIKDGITKRRNNTVTSVKSFLKTMKELTIKGRKNVEESIKRKGRKEKKDVEKEEL